MLYHLYGDGGATLDTDDPAEAKAFAARQGQRLTTPMGKRPSYLPSLRPHAVATRRETPAKYLKRLAKTIEKSDSPDWVGEALGRAAHGWRLIATDGNRLVATACDTDTDPPLDSRIVRVLERAPDAIKITVPDHVGACLARLWPFRRKGRTPVEITIADGTLTLAVGPDDDGDTARETIELPGSPARAQTRINLTYLGDAIGLPAIWHVPTTGTEQLVIRQAEGTICHVIMPMRA